MRNNPKRRNLCICVYGGSPPSTAKCKNLNEWRCRDGMHHAKDCGNKEIPFAILLVSRILARSCLTPPYIIQAKGYA